MYRKAIAAVAVPAVFRNLRRPADCCGMTTSSSEGFASSVVKKTARVQKFHPKPHCIVLRYLLPVRRRLPQAGGASATTSSKLIALRPIHQAESALTTPAKTVYAQINHGAPLPCLSSAVATMGVMPLEKMPENW